VSGLTPEQLEMRRTGIGASESPCIIGLSPHGTEISVWASKMGLFQDESTDAQELGLIIEDAAAQLYRRKTGYATAHFGTIRHPRYPWMLATPDLAIFGERRLAQIKLVGAWMMRHWEEGVPDYVCCQVQHEMEVADAEVCDVIAIVGGTDFRILPVERDREMGAHLVEICRSFFEKHVVTGVMPDPDGSAEAYEAIRARYAYKAPTYVRATENDEADARTWLRAKRVIDEAKKLKDVAEQRLKIRIGEQEGIEGEGFRATWKASKAGVRSFLLKELGVSNEAAAQ